MSALRLAPAFTLLTLLSGWAWGCRPTPASPPVEASSTATAPGEAASDPADEAPELGALEQLCGTWRRTVPAERTTIERWQLEGGSLAGEGLTAGEDGELRVVETLALVADPGGFIYRAQPAGAAEATDFAPIEANAAIFPIEPIEPVEPVEPVEPAEAPEGAQLWLWANPEHDFPQQITYTLAGDRLDIEIAGPGAEPGSVKRQRWTLEREAACGESSP